jgi:hypothetical protein
MVVPSDKLPKSGFVSHLVRINRLDRLGFERFVFFPGMLFLSFKTWWGKNSYRKTAHEGLDLCFFINSRQDQYRLDETIQVPMLFEGRIVRVMDDFLGQTVVARHRAEDMHEASFFTFYAHMMPDHRLRTGDVVIAEKPIGTIADATKTSSSLASHLHISMAWESLLPPVDILSWDILNQVDRSVFIDPLMVLSGSHSLISETPDNHMINKFIKCRLALES